MAFLYSKLGQRLRLSTRLQQSRRSLEAVAGMCCGGKMDSNNEYSNYKKSKCDGEKYVSKFDHTSTVEERGRQWGQRVRVGGVASHSLALSSRERRGCESKGESEVLSPLHALAQPPLSPSLLKRQLIWRQTFLHHTWMEYSSITADVPTGSSVSP